ncbi:hypothetical protein AeRB84_007017 [Aphanomyces euteiches]|nr:hypothetical protein AeRB84_007017 [Aphanomyces euteiches]
MKKQKREMPLLPLDMVVKIAFFIPEWTTLELFMRALRPANSLGPLEHLWQLQHLKWNPSNLWPHLKLSKLDEPSRLYVECIAKYYSSIQVDKSVDPLWLQQFIRHSTCIEWFRSWTDDAFHFEWLKKWKTFRLTKMWSVTCHTPTSGVSLLIENLPHFKYLVDLTWYKCNSALSSAIFQYAATSSTLRILHISTSEVGQVGHCTITVSMANDLLRWIALQPIQEFYMFEFTWEDSNLRNQVAAALLNSTSIKCFKIYGTQTPNISFNGYCGDDKSRLFLEFYTPRRRGVEVVVPVEELNLNEISQDLSGFVRPFFESLLNPKVKRLSLSGNGIFANGVIWEMLIPHLEQSHLEELNLRLNCMADHEAFCLADGIRRMKSLQKIYLDDNCLGFAGMKAMIVAAPATVTHVYICSSLKTLATVCFYHECNELVATANKKSINLFRSNE